MKACPHCGKLLPEEMRFCPYCMTKLITEQTVTDIPLHPRRRGLLWVGGAVALAVLCALLVWGVGRTADQPSTSSRPMVPHSSVSTDGGAVSQAPSVDGTTAENAASHAPAVTDASGNTVGSSFATDGATGGTSSVNSGRGTTGGRSSSVSTAGAAVPGGPTVTVRSTAKSTTKTVANITTKTTNKSTTNAPTKGVTGATVTVTKAPTASSAVGSSDPCAAGHDWVSLTETVRHEEQGHYESIIVDYRSVTKYKCAVCYELFSSLDDYYTHFDEHIATSDNLVVIFRDRYETVSDYEPVYGRQWVVDREAYTEQRVVGRQCRVCGATEYSE